MKLLPRRCHRARMAAKALTERKLKGAATPTCGTWENLRRRRWRCARAGCPRYAKRAMFICPCCAVPRQQQQGQEPDATIARPLWPADTGKSSREGADLVGPDQSRYGSWTEEERQRQAALRRAENSFAAVAEQFIKRHVSKTRKASTVERELRREFIVRWGTRPITDITQHDVVAVIDEVVDRGALYQAHNLFGHIRTLFNWAIARGVYGLDRSPCDRLRPAALIGKKIARQRVLTDDELRVFWRATHQLGYPYGPLFRMLALTGQRKSEVAEARWSEIDLAKKTWTIPAQRMKADATQVVPLSDDVVAILQLLPRFNHGEFLFSTNFGVKPVNGFSKGKARLDQAIAAELGSAVEPFVIHDIRRTMRTRLSALPVPDLVRELVIGTRSPDCTRSTINTRISTKSERRSICGRCGCGASSRKKGAATRWQFTRQ